jgi:hypothetical protein
MVEQRRAGRTRQQELGVIPLIAAQMISLNDWVLAGGAKRFREQVVLTRGQHQAKG